MKRGLLIRRFQSKNPRQSARDPILRWADAAFWLLLVLALGVGGERAVLGVPALVSLLFPPGLIAAEANVDGPSQRVSFAVQFSERESRYAPTVLTPLPSRGFPDWLLDRMFTMRVASNVAPSPVQMERSPVIAIVIDDLGADQPDLLLDSSSSSFSSST